ncbi:MAG: GNAT family N-acetyltransferase [Desulfobacterales bacterium]|nr:GNAT family N-acetyltransferase [Desulfobacterales bacterium]
MTATDITFRPCQDEDQLLLYQIYASTRMEELAVVDWGPVRIETFLTMQFNAQHKFYHQQFTGASFDIIVHKGKDGGRLYREKRKDEIRIIDIALLDAHRNQGIGGSIIKDIQAEAAEAGLAVRINVERNNPALGLYHRLGFKQIEDGDVYLLMEWKTEC